MYRVFGVKFLLYNVVYGNKKDRLTPVFFSGNNLSKLCDLGLVGFPENIQKRRRNCGFPFNIFLPHCCGQDQITT